MEWEEILKLVGANGAFAALFIWLLKRTFDKNDQREDKNEKRETKYHEIINNTNSIIKDSQQLMIRLSDKYDDLDTTVDEGFKDIKKDIKDVFKMCAEKNGGCNGNNTK